MSARKKAKSSPKSQVPEAEKPQEEGDLAPEAGIKKPAEEVNEASTPVAKMPPEEGTEAPTPEIELPVGDGSNNVDKPVAGTEIVLRGVDPGAFDVTIKEPGTEIILGEIFGEMLDATIEEPTYSAHEWQGPAEPPLVMPDETASNEALIEGARRLVQIVGWRMRRTVQEWWLIGRHLAILMDRPENEGRWRKEILPQIGVNHETDYQLRTMSEMVPFEACLNYPNKTRLLRDVGILPPQQPKKQIELQPHAEVEEILGLGDAETYDFGGVDGLPQAAPIEELQPDFGMEPGPQVDVVADAATQPAKAEPTPRTASKPEAKKVAAEAEPQPKDQANAIAQHEKDHDPIAESEALVVTLGGADVADMEAIVAESGFALLSKTEKYVVGLLWFADDDYDPAKEKVGRSLDKLRAVKQKLQVEARYLCASEVVQV